jgi:hypothetical protein
MMRGISLSGAIALSAGLIISLPANAQTAQKPKATVGAKPLAGKPIAPVGCKLVGTVRGTKLWAGDCVASGPAGAAPIATPGEQPSPDQPEGAVPRGPQQ